MRFLSTLIFLGAIGYGAYWVNTHHPELKHKALEMLNTGTVQALEARFTAKQIMEKEQHTLLKDTHHSYTEPTLKFHPYILMEVKFTNDGLQTEEGVILWDLVDGEMVLDTRNWDKTHGFADCMNANADRYEYQILTTIAKNGGKADQHTLLTSLKIEPSLFDSWLERASKKKLIVKHDNLYRIHLHQPRVDVKPSTNLAYPLIAKSYKYNEILLRRYSTSQIKKAAEAAFGTDFAIRNMQEIYLPVYCITVQNPDGSYSTSHWNGLNGKRI